MGVLSYAGEVHAFEDRLLTHLQVVIIAKFRRGESFLMSWVETSSAGDERHAVWLTPAEPMAFTFDGSRVPTIDQPWIERLARSAASSRGLVVTDSHGLLTPGG